MKSETVIAALEATGIRIEDERAVPVAGKSLPLPYMVVRQDIQEQGDDAGRIRIQKVSWAVYLFTLQKEPDLDCKIRAALANVGKLNISFFPDGKPYQTLYEFTTREIGGM